MPSSGSTFALSPFCCKYKREEREGNERGFARLEYHYAFENVTERRNQHIQLLRRRARAAGEQTRAVSSAFVGKRNVAAASHARSTFETPVLKNETQGTPACERRDITQRKVLSKGYGFLFSYIPQFLVHFVSRKPGKARFSPTTFPPPDFGSDENPLIGAARWFR